MHIFCLMSVNLVGSIHNSFIIFCINSVQSSVESFCCDCFASLVRRLFFHVVSNFSFVFDSVSLIYNSIIIVPLNILLT